MKTAISHILIKFSKPRINRKILKLPEKTHVVQRDKIKNDGSFFFPLEIMLVKSGTSSFESIGKKKNTKNYPSEILYIPKIFFKMRMI